MPPAEFFVVPAPRAAARVLASSNVEQRNEALLQIRAAIAVDRHAILAANEMDLEQGRESGLEAALLDRLALTPAQLDVLEQGLRAQAIIIYVARPNRTV